MGHNSESLYSVSHEKALEDIEKQITYLKLELGNTNQLISVFLKQNFNILRTRRCITIESKGGI